MSFNNTKILNILFFSFFLMSAFSSLRLKITLKHLKKFSREESYPHIHQGPSRNLINNEMRKDNFKNSNNEPEKESVISNLTNFTKNFFKNLQKTINK